MKLKAAFLLLILTFSTLTQAEIKQVEPGANKIYIVLLERLLAYQSIFGHIELLFTYPEGSDEKDTVITLGPDASGVWAPNSGGADTPLGAWAFDYEYERYNVIRFQSRKMYVYELDLNIDQVEAIRLEANKYLELPGVRNYNPLKFNCATAIAEIFNNILGLNFEPGFQGLITPYDLLTQLEGHKLIDDYVLYQGYEYTLDQNLKKIKGEMGHQQTFSKQAIKTQLLSTDIHIRTLAYNKLLMLYHKGGLSPSDKKIIETILKESIKVEDPNAKTSMKEKIIDRLHRPLNFKVELLDSKKLAFDQIKIKSYKSDGEKTILHFQSIEPGPKIPNRRTSMGNKMRRARQVTFHFPIKPFESYTVVEIEKVNGVPSLMTYRYEILDSTK